MRLKKIIFVVIVILFLFGGITHGQDLQIYLDKTKLPTDWSLKNIIKIPEKDLSKFSKKLGGEIERLDNYYLKAGDLILQINVLECPTEKEAKKIYNKFLNIKNSKLYCQRKNNIVIEYICKNKYIIKKVRDLNLVQKSKLGTPTINKFLKNNHTQINLNKKDKFSLIDKEVAKNEIFFTAEYHGISINSKLELEFLKYFKDKADIKYHLLELPYSMAELLNLYLETGNEKILKKVIINAKGTYGGTQEEYKYWKQVYKFNKSLPDGEKIKLVGIDIEHQITTSLWYLNTILPDKKQPPATIANDISKIKEMHQNIYFYSKEDINKLFIGLKENIFKNKNDYETYLGDEIFDFKLICENVLTRFEAYNNRDSMKFNNIRDKQMYENFKKIYSHLPRGKYYGQWGMNHTYQRSQNGVNWVASLMDNKDDSPVQGKILSIIYFYKDCMQMQKGKNNPKKINTYSSVIDLEKFAISDLTLFKLIGENSPFSEKIYWLRNSSGGVTSDYFQYIILIKNSEASSVFHDNS